MEVVWVEVVVAAVQVDMEVVALGVEKGVAI